MNSAHIAYPFFFAKYIKYTYCAHKLICLMIIQKSTSRFGIQHGCVSCINRSDHLERKKKNDKLKDERELVQQKELQ